MPPTINHLQMALDVHPTAQASYARTLIERGCPTHLAQAAAAILAADKPEGSRSQSEQQIVSLAWASVTD